MTNLARVLKNLLNGEGSPVVGRFRGTDDATGYAPEHHIAGDDGNPLFGSLNDAAWDGAAGSPTLMSLLRATAAKLIDGIAITAPDSRPAGGDITAVDVASTTAAGQNGGSIITGAPTANSFIAWALTGEGSARLQISNTFVGTLQFEGSVDAGISWYPMTFQVTGTSFRTSAPTGKGLFLGDIAGITNLRVRASALASGTATIKASFSQSVGAVKINGPVSLYDNASGLAAAVDALGLKTSPPGSVGTDRSVGQVALPNVGANFGAGGVYSNYALLKTIAVNAARACIEVQNNSASQLLVVRDDGTAVGGAAPNNATAFALGAPVAQGAQGGAWRSTTFRGRVQIYAPAGTTQIIAFED